MLNFSDMLKYFIKEKNVTINELARSTQIDRSTLYKLTNGTRKPTGPEMIGKIASSLCLNQREKTDLQSAYYLSVLGPMRYYGGKQITDLLNQMNVRKIQQEMPVDISADIVPNETDRSALKNGSDILRALFGILKKAGRNREPFVRIFTTGISSKLTDLLVYLFNTFPGIHVQHLIAFDNSKNVLPDHHLHNLDCLRQIMPLLMTYPNYQTRCIYSSISSLGSFHPMMNEMVLTRQYVCVYSRDMDRGILIHSKEECALYFDIFSELEATGYEFSAYLSPDQFLAQSALPVPEGTSENGIYYLNPGLSSAILLNPEEDDSLIRRLLYFPDDKEKENFLAGFGKYLPERRDRLRKPSGSVQYLTTKQGVVHFTKTGYINEFSPDISSPLSGADRMTLLARWRALYENGAFILLDFPCLRPDSGVCMQYTGQDLYFHISADDGSFLTERIREPNINSLFYWYFKFLAKNYRMKKTDALNCFDRCFEYLRQEGNLSS